MQLHDMITPPYHEITIDPGKDGKFEFSGFDSYKCLNLATIKLAMPHNGPLIQYSPKVTITSRHLYNDLVNETRLNGKVNIDINVITSNIGFLCGNIIFDIVINFDDKPRVIMVRDIS